jgi:hypothetical protein
LRFLWWLRGSRLVRLHLEGDTPSFEGILVGRYGGHYVLRDSKMLQAVDQTVALEGRIDVPCERVVFVQQLAKGIR